MCWGTWQKHKENAYEYFMIMNNWLDKRVGKALRGSSTHAGLFSCVTSRVQRLHKPWIQARATVEHSYNKHQSNEHLAILIETFGSWFDCMSFVQYMETINFENRLRLLDSLSTGVIIKVYIPSCQIAPHQPPARRNNSSPFRVKSVLKKPSFPGKLAACRLIWWLFKGSGHYWYVNTQNNCKHKNLLGNKQWRAVDCIKHCEKRLPLK